MIELTTEILIENLRHLVHSPYMHILFWLMVVDILSGYAKAFKLKKFDSKIGTNGLIRHFMVITVMVLIGTYSRTLGYQRFSVSACVFFIVNYSFSVIENWEALGLPFPPSLKPFFNQMRKNSDTVLAKNLKVDMLKVEEVDSDE